MPVDDDLEHLLRRAGDLAESWFGAAPATLKRDGSPVTEADRAVERLLVGGLRELFPEDRIEGEEGAKEAGERGAVWYVDPIDGTSNFVAGLPVWGPTVCRVVDGRLERGLLYLPRCRELWSAVAGGGLRLNGAPVPPVVDHDPLANDLLFVPSSAHRSTLWGGGSGAWGGKIRCLGSTATHLAHVAAGGAVGAVVPRSAPWDIGAGLLFCHEARRSVVDFDGNPIDPLVLPQPLPFVVGASTAVRVVTPLRGPREEQRSDR